MQRVREQSGCWGTGDGHADPVSEGAPALEREPGEECGGSAVESKIPGLFLHLPAGESDQGGATVGGAVSGQAPATFPRGTWTEPEAVPRGAPTPTARLGWLLQHRGNENGI